MIPQNNIIEWSNVVSWRTNEQVEQDLVICRALVEIFSDDYLAGHLAFRGGTALHKLYLQPQPSGIIFKLVNLLYICHKIKKSWQDGPLKQI